MSTVAARCGAGFCPTLYRCDTTVPMPAFCAARRASKDGPGAMKRGIALYCLICAATYARSTAEARAALPCASAGRTQDDGAMMATDTARDTRDSRRVRLVFTPVLLPEPGHWSAPGMI